MIDEEKDVHDIKQKENGIIETDAVIAQCRPRIETAMEALENAMATYEESPNKEIFEALKEAPEWEAANV